MDATLPLKVLVAEDDAELRRLVCETLRSRGHAVQELSDGGRLLVALTQAHSSAGADTFDVLLADVQMPICTGLDIAETLHQTRFSKPVILMTAFSDAPTRARAARIGAVMVDKPFDLDDLADQVAALAATSRAAP